jgi:hypothetical protein
LRLLVDYGEARWESVPLIMRASSIRAMLDDTIKTARASAERLGIDSADDTLSDKAAVIRAGISIALYSCSKQRDIVDPLRPEADMDRPRVVGRRYQPRRMELGYRVGAAMRRSPTVRVEAEDEPGAGQRTPVSPHLSLRGAHCLVNSGRVSR